MSKPKVKLLESQPRPYHSKYICIYIYIYMLQLLQGFTGECE